VNYLERVVVDILTLSVSYLERVVVDIRGGIENNLIDEFLDKG